MFSIIGGEKVNFFAIHENICFYFACLWLALAFRAQISFPQLPKGKAISEVSSSRNPFAAHCVMRDEVGNTTTTSARVLASQLDKLDKRVVR
jgi:hypothetical protein